MLDDTPTLADSYRQRIRQQVLAARQSMPDAEHAAAVARILAHVRTLLDRLQPRVLGFYWPVRREADLRALLADWLAADDTRRAALPVVVGRGTALEFHRWEVGAAMAAGTFGIPVPAGSECLLPDVLLIPLNAFDAAGYRIGYGGGYFDRTLERHAVCAVGVGFECGRVDSILPQPYDRPMAWIITEAGIFAGATD